MRKGYAVPGLIRERTRARARARARARTRERKEDIDKMGKKVDIPGTHWGFAALARLAERVLDTT